MEIVPGVWRIPGTRGGNVYLVQGDQAALIDTGLPGNAGAVLAFLHAHGIAQRDLTAIFLTHRHRDHTGSLRHIRTATGARALAHEGDGCIQGTGVPPLAVALQHFGGRVQVDGSLHQGQRFPEFQSLEVIATPGHTPGSVCFWLPDAGMLFTGDTVLSLGDRLARPLSRPGGSGHILEQSLARLAAVEPHLIASGHGPPVIEQAATLLHELTARQPRWLGHRVVANWRRLVRFGRDLARPVQ